MSVRAMSAVWDFPCPSTVNGLEFRPPHKFVALAFADHADHAGKNIYPAIETVSKKTGYDRRTVQRLVRDLEAMGLLIRDGTSRPADPARVKTYTWTCQYCGQPFETTHYGQRYCNRTHREYAYRERVKQR